MKHYLFIFFLLLSVNLAAQTTVPGWFFEPRGGVGVSLPMPDDPEARHDMAVALAIADGMMLTSKPERANMSEWSESGDWTYVIRTNCSIDSTFSYDLVDSHINSIAEEYVCVNVQEGDDCNIWITRASDMSVSEKGAEVIGLYRITLQMDERTIEFTCSDFGYGGKEVVILSSGSSTKSDYMFSEIVKESSGSSRTSYAYRDSGFTAPLCASIRCADTMFCAYVNSGAWGHSRLTGIKDNNLYFINY